MSINIATPWHKASFERFLNTTLPQLLAKRVPLQRYTVEASGPAACRVTVTLAVNSGELEIPFDLPVPDDQGIFKIGSSSKVVIPIATCPDLAKAQILCAGEQLAAFIAARLGTAPDDLPWDNTLARAWFPIDTWVNAFMSGVGDRYITAQNVDDTNWLSRATHLRRLIIPDLEDVISPGQAGYVCPFETPEGVNVGHILTIARGAEIQDGHMVIIDDRCEAALGLSASMIPFLEHNDPNRLLMGANMLRQWIPQQVIEPALVQTGHEPDALLSPEFWSGRNLLTAFVSWGNGTFEDGIIVSASCAQRFDTPYALQPGDKLSNRCGTKGVVSTILPDCEMPHLPDGTPVDLVYNFVNLHRRMDFGQVREAVMSRIAYATGKPVIVPPFAAPSSDRVRAQCRQSGLPETGMETLRMGKIGPSLEKPSTVGWVYWGRLFHLAKDKLRTFVDVKSQWGQRFGEMETFMLRDLGAFENIRENLNTRAVRHPDASSLTARISSGPISQAPPPTPLYIELVHRLQIAGIEVVLKDAKLAFRFTDSPGTGLLLARPVPHPWLPVKLVRSIRMYSADGCSASDQPQSPQELSESRFQIADPQLDAAFASVVAANTRLGRIITGTTPALIVDEAHTHLANQVKAMFDILLTPAHIRLGERVLFSGRAVLVPGLGLSLDQLGMPDSMAWTLFEPLILRELDGDTDAVAAHNENAVQALDDVMARSWVILNRAPTLESTALLAFHPVRVPDNALHLHPLVCKWLNSDFDGDQAAVFLPVTAVGQTEAGARLSVCAHLERDPSLLASLVPPLDMLYGLAHLSLSQSGRAEIAEIIREPVELEADFLTRASLTQVLQDILVRDGVEVVLEILEKLMQRGFAASRVSGASISPYLGSKMQLPPHPTGDDPEAWVIYTESVGEDIAASRSYDNAEIGPQLLMVKSSGRGMEQLARLIAGCGPVKNAEGNEVIVRQGYVEGLSAEELLASVAGARRGIAQLVNEWTRMGAAFREQQVSQSFNVLTRALRSRHPGLVFAHAAANEEIDPLTDVESRLLVGLPVES